MGTLKNEMLEGGTFASEADARIEIFDFTSILLQSPPQTSLSQLPNPGPIQGQKLT